MTKMMLSDTTTGKTTPFRPIDPTLVRLYVCGPTVYSRAHIGNARSAVVFDLVFRVLRHVYGEDAVLYARNFTDIDDKIMAAAKARFPDIAPLEGLNKVTDETIGWYHEDMDAIGVLRPVVEPRATQYVQEMVDDIAAMIAAGGAYQARGHVFFSAEANPHRGHLSGRHDLDDDAVQRVEPAPGKRHPADFVLWKPSTDDQPGWDSPWGRGRPGWHIECSAMSTRILGRDFDIHGGGSDLVFPHHDNEISQARCCSPDAGYAHRWLHNGMVTIEGRKMSKSLGNILTVADLRGRLPGGALRLGLLSAQYRSNLNWSEALETQMLSAWEKFRAVAAGAAPGALPEAVELALLGDLNTPRAIAELHALADAGDGPGLAAALDLLGVSLKDSRSGVPAEAARRIEQIVQRRFLAREARDFATADELRDFLTGAGVMLRDHASGTDWEAGPAFDATRLTSAT